MPSSVVAAMHYDPPSATLTIIYVSGEVYEYLGVPENIYNEMKAAKSKGTYLNLKIKRDYPFQKKTASENHG